MSDRTTTLMMERLRAIGARKERFSYHVRGDSYVITDIVVAYNIDSADGPVDLAKVLAHAVDNDSIVSGQRQPDGHVIYTSCRLFTDMQNAERFAREQKQTSVYNWNRYAEMPIKGVVVSGSDDREDDSDEVSGN
ncbi:MAG: hypothetical protein IPI00_10485 [Flavobacteriales bacterium]|nr:hypothetical protein [Flavobacteriales bacterium]MBK6943534.1 hypothetical protein [Flavobacteriales bacterium]MBK7240587.1 hypothetical protein [Flavobacteriales bacterium]MBK7297261.1 hypothetical protein [Flavobacteriales bacterium]MBK9535936.1 hypothetical protein [Flavobacteriales bacterium]